MNKQELYRLVNEFFDHVYVITIPRAAYRMPALQRELEGLEYELFYGADAANFDLNKMVVSGLYDDNKARRNHRFGKSITGGMLGCAWSHRMVYEDILAKGYKNALVLEDDVRLVLENGTSFAKAIDELPADWELLWMDYNKNERPPTFGKMKQAIYHARHFLGSLNLSHKTIRNIYARDYSPHLRYSGFHDHSDAYGLTASGAATLLHLQTPIQWFPDNLLAHAATENLVKAFSLKNKLFYQTSQTTHKEESLISSRQRG